MPVINKSTSIDGIQIAINEMLQKRNAPISVNLEIFISNTEPRVIGTISTAKQKSKRQSSRKELTTNNLYLYFLFIGITS